MDADETLTYVDVRALFNKKNPAAASRLPKIFYKILEGIVHQRDLNGVLGQLEAYKGREFVAKSLEYLCVFVDIRGVERIPLHQKITFCANHPSGGIDGLAMFHLCGKLWEGLSVPVNDLLFSVPHIQEFFIPVDKFGSNARRIEILNAMYASEKPLVIFPAGRTSRPDRGKLKDFPWTGSFIRKSREHRRWIVPVNISGRNSPLFYALWRIRTFLGIRTNLEMFLLVDEMFKRRGSLVKLTVGEPVPPDFFDESRDTRIWAALLQDYTDRLGADEKAGFRIKGAPHGTPD
jgi:putative hemolysin